MTEKASKVITWVMIIIGLYLFSSLYLAKHHMYNIFGYSIMFVASGSMYPEIYTGDLVVVKINDEYTVGDVVTYYNEYSEKLITHRVIYELTDSIVTKGDYNKSNDGEIPKKNVEAKVIKVIPMPLRLLPIQQVFDKYMNP